MLQQIRAAMGNADMTKSFEAFVEIDETYVGGKPRRENVKLDENGNIIPHEDKPKRKRGRGTDKTPVIGVKERSTKKVYARVALPNEIEEDNLVLENVSLNEIDSFIDEKYPDNNFKYGYIREKVKTEMEVGDDYSSIIRTTADLYFRPNFKIYYIKRTKQLFIPKFFAI
jgi:hypothetical protein